VLARKSNSTKVAVQVSLADVVECAVNAALQQREMAFNRIGVVEPAGPHVFLGRVIDGAMARELGADRRVDRAFIGHHVGFSAGALD
jgi:hypothetical protein